MVTKVLKEWRSKQPKGAIMKPETFKKIERSAAKRGATNPSAVAGKAYWNAAEKKYAGRGKSDKVGRKR